MAGTMTTPDLFASGAYVRASDAPAPGEEWAAPRVVVNTDDYTLRELASARTQTLSGLLGALDNKRPTAWDQYGYPATVTFSALLQAYERGGAASGAVHRLLDKCWQQVPRIKKPGNDAGSDWETRTKGVLKAAKVWRALRDLDRRNMVGRYAAVIYRVADGQPLSAPLVRASKLVALVPLYEDQIKVTRWDEDQQSETFGQPLMYQFQSRRSATSTDMHGQPVEWADVHPSRVQIMAEGAVGNFLDGVPLLRPGFNNLIDLEKIAGGSAEGFLKNSSRTISVEFDANGSPWALASTPGQTVPTGSDITTALNDKVKALNRNIDSALLLQGGKATTLQTSQISPGPAFEVAANLFAASVGLPFTILFGQQTGRLASNEDQKDYNARGQSRRENELTPVVEEFISRMQAAGIIEPGDFEVEWAPLDAPGEAEQLANAKTMAEINKTSAEAGRAPVFDENEIRGVADFEEREELKGIPLEGDPNAVAGDPHAAPNGKPAGAVQPLRAAA